MLRVSHHYDCCALGIELREQFHDSQTALRVEITRRLVGENQLRLAHHGASYRHTLLLTARELLRIVLCAVAQAHLAQNLRNTLATFLRRYAHVAQLQVDILLNGKFVDEVEALEHEADASATVACAVLLLKVSHGFAVEQIIARVGIVEESEDVQQRRLAAAARSHYGDELAVFYIYTNAVEGDCLHFFRAEDLGKILSLYHNFCYLITNTSLSLNASYPLVMTRSPGSSPSVTS